MFKNFSKQPVGVKAAIIGATSVVIAACISCIGAIIIGMFNFNSLVNIGGDVTNTNSPFIINPNGDVTINQNSPLPTPIANPSFKIDDNEITNYCVETSNVIWVAASGGIIVGQYVGSVGPEGIDSGVLGLSLDSYDIIPEYAHGALLCKLDTESEWKECGKELIFQAKSNGCLQFDVNDNDKSNNSGAFDVEVFIYAEK